MSAVLRPRSDRKPKKQELQAKLKHNTVRIVGYMYNVSPSTIYKWAKDYRIKLPDRRLGQHRNTLSEDDVRLIRSLGQELTQVELAKKFEVSSVTIHKILHYETWKHVK